MQRKYVYLCILGIMSKIKLSIIILFTAVWWLAGETVQAQNFTVSNFRPLPNDISAYIQPVRDLNDEACALIKIVAPEEFAFSTPLGIVKRHSEVGEVWLYVPKGTRLLTIKHPKWGVLRDYRFPQSLESRMTYELVIALPPSANDAKQLVVRRFPSKVSFAKAKASLYPSSISAEKRKRTLHWEWAVTLTASAGKEKLLPGMRVAVMKCHGFYVFGQTNFKQIPSTSGECAADGSIPSEGYTPYYSGKTSTSVYMFTAGGMHRLSTHFYCYEGVGYSGNSLAWETSDGEWMRNEPLSVKGFAAEIGAMYRIRNLHVQAGVQKMAGNNWNGLLGVGVFF